MPSERKLSDERLLNADEIAHETPSNRWRAVTFFGATYWRPRPGREKCRHVIHPRVCELFGVFHRPKRFRFAAHYVRSVESMRPRHSFNRWDFRRSYTDTVVRLCTRADRGRNGYRKNLPRLRRRADTVQTVHSRTARPCVTIRPEGL